MKEEISAGIILFNKVNGKFLLLNYPSKHWDFVKGKMEKGETPHETALRETNEETGISDVEFIDGFEEEIEYYFYANNQEIHKKVIFFLGKTKTLEISYIKVLIRRYTQNKSERAKAINLRYAMHL